jgi:hypothetical protein
MWYTWAGTMPSRREEASGPWPLRLDSQRGRLRVQVRRQIRNGLGICIQACSRPLSGMPPVSLLCCLQSCNSHPCVSMMAGIVGTPASLSLLLLGLYQALDVSWVSTESAVRYVAYGRRCTRVSCICATPFAISFWSEWGPAATDVLAVR